MAKFSPGASALLNENNQKKYYVYRLVDPRTLHTFYVGKGCGDRVFNHINDVNSLVSKDETIETLKGKQILDIHLAGKEVICIIHRRGLSESTAFEVESALIDCYPGLTNVQSGHYSDRGVISVEDLEALATAAVYSEPAEKYVIIKTTLGAINATGDLYKATQSAWQANLSHAKRYKYVLSVVYGIVREVYEVSQWHQIGDRIGFDGAPTTNANLRDLIGKLIPAYYRKKGMARPFLYKK